VFYPCGHKYAHDVKYGPGYLTIFGQQWIQGKHVLIWPDGNDINPVVGAGKGWKGFKYEGTVEVTLPPVMVNYWSGAKKQ